MRRWTIILIQPKEGGNCGAAARVLKNFGCGGLRVVAPRCEVNGPEARRFSSGAAEILRSAPVFDTLAEAIADRELTIGLSGVSGRLHRLDCIGLLPTELIREANAVTRGALVFGREERGMEGDEMEQMDFLWSLPTSPEFPSLNLAQAIGITLSAMAEAERQLGRSDLGTGLAPSTRALNPLGGSPDPADVPATASEVARLQFHMQVLMDATGWRDDRRTRGSLLKIRNLLSRARATQREVNLLHGLCRETLRTLGKPLPKGTDLPKPPRPEQTQEADA